MQWVECIPNFSEGRNPKVIQAIAESIKNVKDVYLLHVDSGYDANRTVFTFVGEIHSVAEAAFAAIQTAASLIDMSMHQGEHPRIGACDVCPFVPLGNTAMQDVVQITHRLGKKLGEAGIPVFMYESSALKPERKNLAFIRKGEYEQLEMKLKSPEWYPDYGPKSFNKKLGAMVLGARKFLVAYNVNLESKDLKIARKIAAKIREIGYRNQYGHHPGLLQGVKAIGWWMEKYQCVQVSTNIFDIEKCDILQVFNAVKEEAATYGILVNSSELIGLIPSSVIMKVGQQLIPGEKNQDRILEEVSRYLGLKNMSRKRILENEIPNFNSI